MQEGRKKSRKKCVRERKKTSFGKKDEEKIERVEKKGEKRGTYRKGRR